jgi:hypothetical protein
MRHDTSRSVYHQPIKPPRNLIDPEGDYQYGWFKNFDGTVDVDKARAPQRRLKYWFHLHFDTETHLVTANIAHMGILGNTSIVIVNKQDGTSTHANKTRWLWRNRITQSGGCADIKDLESDSFISQDANGEVHFQLVVDNTILKGHATASLGPPFIQCTRYRHGFGTIQWWGNLTIKNATLTCDDTVLLVPPGTVLGFDRTIGHRPRKQEWNWLSAHGHTQGRESQSQFFSLQVAVDHLHSSETHPPNKFNLWLGRSLYKFEHAKFMRSPGSLDNSEWTIVAKGTGAAQSLNATFNPVWRRRERQGVAQLFGGDFNQLYGPLRGTFTVNGQTHSFEVPFAIVEDSVMAL